MADIYLAVARGALGFSKLVVLKHLRNDDEDRRSLDMFLDEARLAPRLSHPNIVDTYDVGQDGDSYFIAMEYLEGQSLSRILRGAQGTRISPTVWARIVADALRGLHYAHELCDYDGAPLGIVHRDVSPPNIFITYTGETKIVDFGIAKAKLNTFQTEAGVFKGKLGYMAPEQAVGPNVDRLADIFSMGVVLWEALAGRKLFDRGIRHYLDTQGQSALPQVHTVNPEIDPALSRIVAQALAMEPGDRYATAAEMGHELEKYLARAPDVMSKVDIGRKVLELFADHRASVQREIEKHLATADRAVVEGDFWTTSGIVIAGTRNASPVSPITARDISFQSTPIDRPRLPASSSTHPHALSDSWPAREGRPWVRWLVIGGAVVLVATLGIRLRSRRMEEARRSPASVETDAAEIMAPARSPENSEAVSPSATARSEAQATPLASRSPGQRFVRRSKKWHSAQQEPLDETAPLPPVPPSAAAQPEGPIAAPVTAAPVVPPAPAASPAPAPGKQASSQAPQPPSDVGPPPGTVEAKQVAVTVRAHASEVRTCWERARMDQPDLHGRLTVQATISPAGRVVSASATHTLEGGARLQTCVVSAFQTWTFPAPTGGINGSITYSFVFE